MSTLTDSVIDDILNQEAYEDERKKLFYLGKGTPIKITNPIHPAIDSYVDELHFIYSSINMKFAKDESYNLPQDFIYLSLAPNLYSFKEFEEATVVEKNHKGHYYLKIIDHEKEDLGKPKEFIIPFKSKTPFKYKIFNHTIIEEILLCLMQNEYQTADEMYYEIAEKFRNYETEKLKFFDVKREDLFCKKLTPQEYTEYKRKKSIIKEAIKGYYTKFNGYNNTNDLYNKFFAHSLLNIGTISSIYLTSYLIDDKQLNTPLRSIATFLTLDLLTSCINQHLSITKKENSNNVGLIGTVRELITKNNFYTKKRNKTQNVKIKQKEESY